MSIFSSPYAVKDDASVIASLSNTTTGWAFTMSKLFASMGFLQQNDTGQAVWVVTSLTLSAVSVSGANATYTYDGTVTFGAATNPTPRVGMSVTITGFTNGNNNVTATITALGGSGASSTFTVTKVSQANETHAGTAVTTVSTLPTVQATVTNGLYEVWKSNDGLTAFYFKIEYGQAAANVPGMAITFGTASNGSGSVVASGNFSTREVLCPTAATAGGTSNTYNCYFSGGTNGSRFSILMWQNATTTIQSAFLAVERSKVNSGADTS